MQTSIFQTNEWAQFKTRTGYQQSHRIEGILVLEKKLPLGRTMLYSPMVSLKNYELRITNDEFLNRLKSLARDHKTIFYRLELDFAESAISNPQSAIKDLSFRKAFEEMQPEHTLILDITPSESEILEQMKQKGRYNIKIADKSNITYSWSNKPGNELNNFYTLYKEMARRQKISYREKSYFEALLEILGSMGYARVYCATTKTDSEQTDNRQQTEQDISRQSSIDGQIPLAAAIVTYYEGRATYLYGGSSSEMRNLMAPYGLHWQIIKDARSLACTEYDFFGIAPTDDENHPWAGITRFKKQFGGNEVSLVGSWDLVFKPIEYQAFKIAEKIRR